MSGTQDQRIVTVVPNGANKTRAQHADVRATFRR